MSRQNKVNPGMYTQRGRLTQDDAARELAKQRAIGSEHTWQPVQRDAKPRLTANDEGAADDAAEAEPAETVNVKPARVTAKAKPARKTATRKTAKRPASTTARAKKTTASSGKVKPRSAGTTKAKAKSAKRRKS